jgi:hypothetical protein
MKSASMKVITVVGFAWAVMLGLAALATTPVAHADCEPVVCPAIVKICPQGQLACRPSPCNCAQVCAAEGHGCNAPTEPLQ